MSDYNTPWSEPDFSQFSDDDNPHVMSMEKLRDTALRMFDAFLAKQAGISPDDYIAPDDEVIEAQRAFLSLPETEVIVKSFSQGENSELFAIGGDSPQAAVQQINNLMIALVQRIMSNVVAEGVKRDLIDVAFDDKMNDFAFCVNKNGHALLKEHYGDYE